MSSNRGMVCVFGQTVHLRLTCILLLVEFNLTVYESNKLKKHLLFLIKYYALLDDMD